MANPYILQSIDQKTIDEYYKDGLKDGQAEILIKAIAIAMTANPLALIGLMRKLNKDDEESFKISKGVHGLASAYHASCNPEIYKNHIDTIGRGRRLLNGKELAASIEQDRSELSTLLKKIGMGKKDKPEGYSDADVVLIKDLYKNYGNLEERVAAYNNRNKNLAFIGESDLLVRSSKKLKNLNEKTGLFD
jgi:hypothetical protein